MQALTALMPAALIFWMLNSRAKQTVNSNELTERPDQCFIKA